MKLAMSSWSYHWAISSGKMDQMDWIELARELYLDGVELLDIHFPSLEPDYLRTLKEKLKKSQLQVPACSVSNDFGFEDEEKRNQNELLVEKWIEIAKIFDAKVLRVFSGWPGEHNPEKYESEKRRLWGEMVIRLKRLAEKAKNQGIVLGLENHNHFGFTKTADDILKILKEVNSDFLRVTLDSGDYLVDTADINGWEAFEKVLPYACFIHLKLYEADDLGMDRKQDYVKLFELLFQKGYDDWVSIEYEGKPEPEQVPRSVVWIRRAIQEKHFDKGGF